MLVHYAHAYNAYCNAKFYTFLSKTHLITAPTKFEPYHTILFKFHKHVIKILINYISERLSTSNVSIVSKGYIKALRLIRSAMFGATFNLFTHVRLQ